MSAILDMHGNPISSIDENDSVKGKPAWQKPTKKEDQLLKNGFNELARLTKSCVDFIHNNQGNEDAIGAKLNSEEKKWIQYAGQLNSELVRLNKSHPGFSSGRQPRTFIPKALENAIRMQFKEQNP